MRDEDGPRGKALSRRRHPVGDHRRRETQAGWGRHHETQGESPQPSQELVANHDARLGHAGNQVQLAAQGQPAFVPRRRGPRCARPGRAGLHLHALVDALRLAAVAMRRGPVALYF